MTGAERRQRLARARLYVCTPIRDDLDAFLRDILGAGADIVQLRDKAATPDELVRAAAVFRAACDDHGALFVVNDSVEVALAAKADGVHLGQDDADPSDARAIAGAGLLIGRSTHAPEELERAHTEPVDYLGVGPVHPTPTKPGRPGVGLGYVRFAAARSELPWFVTGGMDARTIPETAAAGARRFVVVRAITASTDPAAETRRLVGLLPP